MGSHLSQSIRYTQPGTGLDWIVVVVSPMLRLGADTIEDWDVLNVCLILVVPLGATGCGALLGLWIRHRQKRPVMYGDFVFTSWLWSDALC